MTEIFFHLSLHIFHQFFVVVAGVVVVFFAVIAHQNSGAVDLNFCHPNQEYVLACLLAKNCSTFVCRDAQDLLYKF